MENNKKIRDLYELYIELGHDAFEEKIKKPMEACLHNSGSTVISMNSLDTIIVNAMEKPKLGEASLYKNNLFCSSALDEIFCLDNVLSPICDNSNDACDILNPPTESIAFEIPMEIVEMVIDEPYVGDGTVHPSDHLLKLKGFCELFKLAGLSRENAMKKLFPLSLKDKAREWYELLDDPHHSEWKELEYLFYSKFYPPYELHLDRNYIYNFYPHDGESIARAWGRLKTLILKCPNHELPEKIIVNNFYARLSGHCKDYLDACSEGSFTSKKVQARWDLLERIQNNAEDWENDKGKELGINYEYDCIKSFVETAGFQELCAKYGLDSHIIVDCFRTFASHINVPKENWDVYHEPFKDTCMENEIVVNDCNKQAQTSENTISYKHVNFCGMHRPCEKNQIEDEYCIHHRNEKTRTWNRALDDLGEKVCALYPFICELCHEVGHFNFQCSGHDDSISNLMSTSSLYCDNMITPNQHDELTLFLGCEELSRKTSLLNMSDLDMNSVLHGCYLYCVNNCHANTYIQNIIKDGTLPKYDRTNMCFVLINEREESSQVSSVVSNNKPGYVEKLPFKPLPPIDKMKTGKKKKKRSKRREETVSSPKHVAHIIIDSYNSEFDDSELDDEPIPVTYISDHDWEKHTSFDIENLWGTNSENDDVNNCHTISTIHASSNDDMKSSKLGDEVFENPFATDDYMFDTSPSSKNDDMFTDEHTLEDNYFIAYDDTMPPIFDNYYKEYYDIGYNYNHPHETCHNYGRITQNHLSNIQLVYNVQVRYDDCDIFSPSTFEDKIHYDYSMPPIYDDYNDGCDTFTPTATNKTVYDYVERNDIFMHGDHDKNALCDSYIVEFINDATENYYERGRHGFIYLNNIKSPLFMSKVLKLHLFCLPMLVTLCFIDLFSYKIPLHRKWVRLKCV